MTPDFESDLTIQQQAFVAEYCVHFNGRKAAQAAGYSENSLSSIPSQLLSNPKVKAAIVKTLKQVGNEHEILRERVLNQLSNIAFGDPTEFYEVAQEGYVKIHDLKKLPRELRTQIQELKSKTTVGEFGVSTETTLRLFSKEKATELLGRHMAMFTDKKEVAGKLGLDHSVDQGLWDLKASDET